MRVLYITVSLPYHSSETFFIPELHELLRQGCEVMIVPRSPKGWEVLNQDAEGLEKYALRQPILSPRILVGAALMFLAHMPASLHALALLFKSRNILTLVKNLLVYPKGLWLASVAKHWNADHIHAQWGTTTATMVMTASRVSGIPWSCTVHRGDIVANNLLEVKAKEAQFFRVISEDGITLAADTCGRLLQGNVVVLRLGVECPAAPLSSRPLHDPPVLICPALLIERKGHRYLLEALDILRQRGQSVHLRLAGEGEMRNTLESMVLDLGLADSVKFLGQVGHADLLGLYENGSIDMIVLPTLHEGVPVCLMEAMAYGIPVVSTSTGGIPELLRDGAGVMVPQKDSTALADAIEQLLEDSGLRKSLAEAGRRRIENEYSVKAIVGRLMEYIESVKK